MGATPSGAADRDRDPGGVSGRLAGRPGSPPSFTPLKVQRPRGLDGHRRRSRLRSDASRALSEIGSAADRESAALVLGNHAALVARFGRAGRAGEVLLAEVEDTLNDCG